MGAGKFMTDRLNGNGKYIKIGVWTLIGALVLLSGWWVDLQGKVDARQDIQIESKVDKVQYWRDQDRMFQQLDRIEKKVTK